MKKIKKERKIENLTASTCNRQFRCVQNQKNYFSRIQNLNVVKMVIKFAIFRSDNGL